MEKKSESDDAVISFLSWFLPLSCQFPVDLPGLRQASSDQYFLGWTRHRPGAGRGHASHTGPGWSAGQSPHCWHCHQVPIITVKTIQHLATLTIASCRHSHSLDFCSCLLGGALRPFQSLLLPPELCVCVQCIISKVGYCEWRPCHSNNITRPLWWSPCPPPRVNYWLPILSHLTRSSDTIPLPGPALDIVSCI